MLEDLIVSAINDAVRKVESESKDSMTNMTAGIPLPPGFKLPF
jgi:DNA-binding protein YbaB